MQKTVLKKDRNGMDLTEAENIKKRWQAESKWRLFTVPPPKPSIRRCELWLIHLDMMLLMGNTPTGSECFNIPIPALTSPSVKRPRNHSILTSTKAEMATLSHRIAMWRIA